MTFNRLLAKVLDLLVVAALATFPGWVGDAAGLTYALVADGLFEGQSLGKRVVGLRVVGASGLPCTFLQSVQRNLTVAVGVLLMLQRVPFVWWLFWLVGALVLLFEAFLAATDDEALRLGDRLAETQIVVAPRLGAPRV
ncbi:MAG TPA: RDD family protein [Thermodesulfobacteriota bacterium]